VVSIGGNDLGFANVVQTCLEDYVAHLPPCRTAEQAQIDAAMPAAMVGVAKAIDEIRATLAADGYTPSMYRIVLQSYPSAIPRSAENRYPELGPQRSLIGGCPFYNTDSDWARDSVGPEIANHLRFVAASKGVQFLDLRDALQAREICSKSDSLATPTNQPSSTTSEWARFVTVGTVAQGSIQEAFHPNAYAQQALGTCLSLIYSHPIGNFACHNTPGGDDHAMTLIPIH
jgi:hypothetical protein